MSRKFQPSSLLAQTHGGIVASALLLALGLFGCGKREPDGGILAHTRSDHRVYTAISSGENFRRQLREAIGREAAKAAPDWPAAKVDRLADMARDYLVAFNTGDFETYWRFRVPTGRCFLPAEDTDTLRRYILNRQEISGDEHITERRLAALRDPKALMALAWKLMGPGAREPGLPRYAESNADFRGVALDEMEVHVLPVAQPDYEIACFKIGLVLQDRSGGRYPRGIHRQTGMLQPLPHFSTTAQTTAGGVRVVAILLPVKLESGAFLPEIIAAYWSDTEERFLPIVRASDAGPTPRMIPF